MVKVPEITLDSKSNAIHISFRKFSDEERDFVRRDVCPGCLIKEISIYGAGVQNGLSCANFINDDLSRINRLSGGDPGELRQEDPALVRRLALCNNPH